jgi:hypothetical protein
MSYTFYYQCKCGKIYSRGGDISVPDRLTPETVEFPIEELIALRLAERVTLIQTCINCYRDARGYQGDRSVGYWRP